MTLVTSIASMNWVKIWKGGLIDIYMYNRPSSLQELLSELKTNEKLKDKDYRNTFALLCINHWPTTNPNVHSKIVISTLFKCKDKYTNAYTTFMFMICPRNLKSVENCNRLCSLAKKAINGDAHCIHRDDTQRWYTEIMRIVCIHKDNIQRQYEF